MNPTNPTIIGSATTVPENRLKFWLQMGRWTAPEAMMLLCGVDPDRTRFWGPLHSDKIMEATALNGNPFEDPEAWSDLESLQRRFDDLWRIWGTHASEGQNSARSPREWIVWARTIRHSIPWLDEAYGEGLVPRDQESEGAIPGHTDSAGTGYETPWLRILRDAVGEFFEPRRSPDPKKDEVVDWINARAKDLKQKPSANIASAIFTVIKPSDHDPRRRSKK